jgi:hypothetical protein
MPLNDMFYLKKSAYGEVISAHRGITNVYFPLWEGAISFPMSFVTANQMTMKMYFPFPVTIVQVRTVVTTALSDTNNGTVTCGNATGASTGGVATVAASAAVGDEDSATPTTNNTVAAGSYYYCTSAKTLTGGEIVVTLEYLRTAI